MSEIGEWASSLRSCERCPRKVISVSSAIQTGAAIMRLCLKLQGSWDTLSLTFFLGLEPADTATTPELLASLLLVAVVPFQGIILALTFC